MTEENIDLGVVVRQQWVVRGMIGGLTHNSLIVGYLGMNGTSVTTNT